MPANAGDGAKRSPNASYITPATFSATSMPTSSNSVIGPTGKPNCTIRSSSSSIAVPSASRCPASFMYGVRIRFTQNPGLSLTTIAVLPMRRPNATAVLTTPGAVRADGITSSSGMRATGEKKCIPITCSGRRAASAMRPIGMVEVLDAKTARSAVAISTSRSTCCLTARSSNTASITRSAPPKPAYVSAPDSRARGQAGPEAIFDGLERGERRRVVALRLLEDLFARTPKHQPPAERIAVEQPPHEAAGALPPRAPAARHPFGGGEGDIRHDGGVHELVDEPEPKGLLRPLHFSREDHVERRARTDQARQPLAAARGRQHAQLHLGQTELRLGVVGSDAVMAGQSELEPAAQARAVDPDGDRLGKARHALEQCLTLGGQPLRFGSRRERDKFFDVRAGDEVVRLPREKRDRLHGLVALQRLEGGEEVRLYGARDLVDRLALQVECDDRDPVRDFPREGGSGHQRRSSTIAKPMPPCAQIESNPNCTSRRAISLASVVTMRAPVAPKGCPIAIEPPITLMISGSISQPNARHPCRFESTCAANASCTSTRPRSRHSIPARSSALGTAKIGACNSCQPGSTAATAYDRMYASGVYPSARAAASLVSSTAAAPSVSGEEFAAVTLP